MKRLLNEVKKNDGTVNEENELFLDNSNNPLLKNKNYIVKKNTSGTDNIISYSANDKRDELTSDNLNGDNSLYKAYVKEVEKMSALVNSVIDDINKGNTELANFNISGVV